MEKLVKPALTKPTLPSPTKEYKEAEDREVPDHDNQGETYDCGSASQEAETERFYDVEDRD